jgi:GT2 family glycosyltransferase
MANQMPGDEPQISVVVPTRDRPTRLAALLRALRAQTLDPGRWEAVVVDDASGPQTAAVLERERGPLRLRVLRPDRPGGPAAARNAGWRAAAAPVVAFTDDDCAPTPDWLEALLAASRQAPGAVVQGPTRPDPREVADWGPFSHTLRASGPGPWFETSNILYPRELLERLGGFDVKTFRLAGDDTDLGWRARSAGAPAVYEPRAVMHHAVVHLGPLHKLKLAARWSDAVANFARHPELRRHLWGGMFWRPSHYLLLRTLVALCLPRVLRPLQLVLLLRYARFLVARAPDEHGSPLLAPYYVAWDAAELWGILRGALRYRVLVL